MPWRNAQSVPFTRIGIVSQVPSESGVFALIAGDAYVLVAESWNLKARLLDLINTLTLPVEMTVLYELCPEADAEARKLELRKEFMPSEESAPAPSGRPPGITFWSAPGGALESAEGREV